MQLPRGPPAGFEKLTPQNGISWSRGMESVIISNGCDRILPLKIRVPTDWLDDCAPAASAAGDESPSAIMEATPPSNTSISPSPSPFVQRLRPEVEDILMRLCCVSTQIIQYARSPPPADARFTYDTVDLALHSHEDGYAYGKSDDSEEDYSDDCMEDLQSARGGDFGGVTPSSATRVFHTSTVSPVYEPQLAPSPAVFKPPSAALLAPLPPDLPEVVKPSLLRSSSLGPLGPLLNLAEQARNPAERALGAYHTRAREAAATSVHRSAAGTSQEPPPPPPVDLPPAPGPPPSMNPTLSGISWEHLLDGTPPVRLAVRDCRLIRQAQYAGDSLDRTLYGRLDEAATRANLDRKGRPKRVMAYSELGHECRAFLGPVKAGINYPSPGGVTFGGIGRRNNDLRGYQYVKVPLSFVPVRPDFELVASVARSLDLIRNLDDQRAYDAGIAAEYFMSVRASYAPVPDPLAAGPSASHGESRVDPALLGFSALPLERQEFMCLTMMLANMTDAMVNVYQDFATPRDIFLHIRRQRSDALAARVPLMLVELRRATMDNSEPVDVFFRRVRGLCTDLRSAGYPQPQRHAMHTIINGIMHPRFDSLRLQFGLALHQNQPVDYWTCLAAYRSLDFLNVSLPKSDPRHPGWSRDPPQVPANAAFQRGRGPGPQGSGTTKRRLDCTWGPCLSKTSHSEDRCWTKHPHLRKAKAGAPGIEPVPVALALPGSLTRKQLSSLQAQIDGYAMSKN